MNDSQRPSPVPSAPSVAKDARNYATADFQVRELQAVAKVRIQALRSRGMTTPAADPQKLPALPNTVLGIDPFVLWRAPDDWLVYSQVRNAEAMNNWAAGIASYAPLVVTDISSAGVVFELRGARAVDILMRDCTLDLEGDAIRPGFCAQTQFAQTTVLIHRPEQPDTWRLFVERSVGLHVWEWVLDTAGAALAPAH